MILLPPSQTQLAGQLFSMDLQKLEEKKLFCHYCVKAAFIWS